MMFIGIDPGASKKKGHGAGIAVINQSGKVKRVFHAPTWKYSVGKTGKPRIAVDSGKLYELLQEIIGACPVWATIEHPTPLPKTFDVPIRATCELFMHYGTSCAILDLLCDKVLPVHPNGWKKSFNLTADKETSLILARSIFPAVNLQNRQDHNLAEALLLAEYGRLIYEGRKNG